jgi:hypothetical protein
MNKTLNNSKPNSISEIDSEDGDQTLNGEDQITETKPGMAVYATLVLLALTSLLGFIWWSSLGFASPWNTFETRDAGVVLDVSYLHGLGTRTLIKTPNDLLLLDRAVRIQVGTDVVLQSNAFAERLCIRGSDRCWNVVNR